MKMTGKPGRSRRTQRCKSRPSISGIRTSVIKQLVLARKSLLQELFCKRKHPRREAGGFNEARQRFASPGVIIHNSYDGFCDAIHQEHPLYIPILAGMRWTAYYVFI